jgi:hypothetical protein
MIAVGFEGEGQKLRKTLREQRLGPAHHQPTIALVTPLPSSSRLLSEIPHDVNWRGLSAFASEPDMTKHRSTG